MLEKEWETKKHFISDDFISESKGSEWRRGSETGHGNLNGIKTSISDGEQQTRKLFIIGITYKLECSAICFPFGEILI